VSTEFDALMASTQLEREKADGIKSLIAASKLAARYQHRAEKAEAALARVYVLCDSNIGVATRDGYLLVAAIRKALEGKTP
jgi:hypothetical protein